MSTPSDTHESAGEAIRADARKSLGAAAANVRKARSGQGVHGARRSLKRLRSLLRLIEPAIGKSATKAADGHLKAAADRLAGARRSEALLLAATKLGTDRMSEQALAAAIGEHTHGHRTVENHAAAVREALEHIGAVRRQISHWALPRAGIEHYLEGLKRSYAKARKGLTKSLGGDDAEAIHEARKHVIHTLHHLELLQRLWPNLGPQPLDELTGLREALGDFNDLAELGCLAVPELFADPASHSRTLAKLKKRKTALLKTACKQSRNIFAPRPGAFTRRIGAMWEKAIG